MLNSAVNKKIFTGVFVLGIILSLGLGVVAGAQYFAPSPLAQTQLLPAPKTVPEFKLENHRGEAINADIFRDQWNLVFFGFTSCPDFCPLELQKLAKLLALNENQESLHVVFISVDPERDTRNKLAEYVSFFSPGIVGVRGNNSEVAKVAQFFGAAYDRSVIVNGKLLTVPAGINMPTDAGDSYQVNHSTRVFVVNPEGEFVGTVTSPYEVDVLLADIQQLMGK